jgi:hypothetical protein
MLCGVVYVGCKQNEGDRCQVNSDCASGVCNQAKGTCSANQDTDDIDAAVPDAIDAPGMPDAPMADAPAD